MKHIAILVFFALGLGFWSLRIPTENQPKQNRSYASQMDFDDDGEEEYDFHESINIRKSKDAKPILKGKSDKKQHDKNAPHKDQENKIIDVLEDSEFS